MKLRCRLTASFLIPSAIFLCSCDKSFAGNKASSEVSRKSSFTPPLQQVISHLDMNGQHFSVTNVDGDLELLCKFADEIISAFKTSESPIPKGFSLRKILLKSGLNQITAKGESSRELPQYWHNRTFYATGGHRDGVLSILGGKGKPFVVGDYAPAGADLVFETELNLKQIRDLAEFISGEFSGEAQRNVSQAFNQKLMGGAMSLADLFGQFDVRFSCALTLDNQHSWKMDGVELPEMDFVARLDHGVWLWNEYGKELEKNLKVESHKGVKIYSAPEDIPSPMGKLRPVLVVDKAKDQVWFALSKASYLACLDGKPKLGTSTSFQKATAGLSESGNVLGYISPECCSTLIGLVQKGVEQNADRDVKQSILSLLSPIVKKLNESSGYAFTLANLDDGILMTANAPISTHSLSFVSGQVPLMSVANLYFMKQTSCQSEMLSVVRESETSVVRVDFQSLENALQMYRVNAGMYPSQAQGFDALVKRPTTSPKPKRWVRIMDAVPKDPWNRPYIYKFPGSVDPSRPEIISYGKDGIKGTEDDMSSQKNK